MRRFYAAGFLVLMAFDTLSQVSFKLVGGHTAPPETSLAWLQRLASCGWFYAAIAGYLGAFVTWMTLLEHAPIGPAFAASHLEVVSVLVISIWLFDERVGPLQWLGALLILAGIVCLARSKTGVARS
jgi:drug/metabolite transporter (DMT)-like permease